MFDYGGEFDNLNLFLLFIYVDGNMLILFDFLLMEEECVLLE